MHKTPTHNCPIASRRLPSKIAAVFLCALLVLFGLPLGQLGYARAFAATTVTDGEISETQHRVEDSAAAYEAAEAELERLEVEQAALQEQIASLQASIPDQKSKASDALCSLYKMRNGTSEVIQLVFGSESFGAFLAVLDGLNSISNYYFGQLQSLNTMMADLQQAQERTVQARKEAEEQKDIAYAALIEAQQLRQEVQAKQNAERAAEEEAVRQQAQQAQEEAQQQSASEEAAQPTQEITGPTNDNADWSTDKATFVNSWAARIDAYLSGSPLSGTGAIFAEAAWDYGVDPRWSPAISCLESSKGLYCFLPHNAWGWGSCSWDSWDEAIRDHVRGLGRYYGYTITPEHAQTYCPPNWEYWYTFVSAQMDRI